MTARQKIEGLTSSWIGFFIIGGLLTLLMNGFGFFSLIFTIPSIAFNVILAWFLGQKLAARSSLTRTFLLVVNGLGLILCGLGALLLAWQFLHTFSFTMLFWAAYAVVHAGMNVRSLRVLLHPSVRSYVG